MSRRVHGGMQNLDRKLARASLSPYMAHIAWHSRWVSAARGEGQGSYTGRLRPGEFLHVVFEFDLVAHASDAIPIRRGEGRGQ